MVPTMTQHLKSKVLLPLYIYPHPGAWDPLFTAISANPALEFLIIVNPNSGPGSPPWWPNVDYVREIPRLNSLPNVKTIGYVRIAYCQRSISEAFQDIEAYSAWSRDKEHPSLYVGGIFFDETPNLYSEEVKSYLDAITQKVKEDKGILGEKLVIHNPGTAVDAKLADPGPDITTVVEESYAKFRSGEYQRWLSTSPYDRSRSCYMVHSVPEEKVESLTHELRERAEWLFVTDQRVDFYHSFASSWIIFLKALGQGFKVSEKDRCVDVE